MVSRLVGRRRRIKKRSERREEEKKRRREVPRALTPASNRRPALHLFISSSLPHYSPLVVSNNFNTERRSATSFVISIYAAYSLLRTPHAPNFSLPIFEWMRNYFWILNSKCLGLAAHLFAIRNSLCAKKCEFAFAPISSAISRGSHILNTRSWPLHKFSSNLCEGPRSHWARN